MGSARDRMPIASFPSDFFRDVRLVLVQASDGLENKVGLGCPPVVISFLVMHDSALNSD
jgi:hypothetical protein